MDTRAHNSEICPVNEVIKLVQQQDIEHLRDALLDCIEQQYNSAEVYIYEHTTSIYHQSREFSPTLSAYRGTNIDLETHQKNIKLKGDNDSIQFVGFNYLEDNHYVQVFTIESERSSRGLLVTICPELINEDYINILTEVYNCQVILLRNRDTDALTGLLNRQSFDSRLSKIQQSNEKNNRNNDKPLNYCFALLDIDFFKKVNDKYGHVYGDEVLLIFADLMKKSFRQSDMLFRYGGEEFAVLLHDVDITHGKNILERFRATIEEFDFPLQNKVTTSIGYCLLNDQIPLPTLIENADKALYYSKENGRNQVNNYENLLSEKRVEDRIIDDGDIELF